MPVDPVLRQLQIDIPARPEALVRLSLLMADDDMNLGAAAALIEADMALAAAVMKAVNSSLYGLKS
ncbi:MAG TPA: HDOD domain-containing protein, partial [Rubrivivax sp.]|nr:HDOD domain-containing protein [Rubrivivax sp.]